MINAQDLQDVQEQLRDELEEKFHYEDLEFGSHLATVSKQAVERYKLFDPGRDELYKFLKSLLLEVLNETAYMLEYREPKRKSGKILQWVARTWNRLKRNK